MKILSVIFLVGLLSVSTFSQSKEDSKLIEIVKKVALAQQTYEPNVLEDLYASDYIEISPKGEIDARPEAIGFYKIAEAEKAVALTPRYILDQFKVRNYGKFAMITSRLSFGSKSDDSQPARALGIVQYGLRKEKGKWKLFSAQYTPFPPPKPSK